jgi:ABC-type uncharacterized transport system auxiliary subunit
MLRIRPSTGPSSTVRQRLEGTILAACLVAILPACSFTAAPVRYFEIRPPGPERHSGSKLPSVMVPDFSCLSAYDHLRVVLRKSTVEVLTSRNLQWTTVPGRMIAQGLRGYLEATGRFETVRRDAKPPPPYTIEGLLQVIELDEKPKLSARLAMHINVRRSADGSVIGEEFIDQTRAAKGGDFADGVMALRDLYAEVLADLSGRIIAAVEEDLRRNVANQ